MQKINALPAQVTTQTVPPAMNPASQVNPLPANALELKDIHIPEQISNYPVAYGWWLLAVLFILVTIFSIIKIKKAAKRNRVKKQALAQLSFSLENNAEMTTSDTIALLKWAAMHYFSRIELAKLFGDSLQRFLTAQLPVKHQKGFTDLSEQAFLNQYHAQPDTSKDTDDLAKSGKNLNQAAMLWLTHALPPNQSKIKNKSSSINNENQGVNT